jgi:hypothetical protein
MKKKNESTLVETLGKLRNILQNAPSPEIMAEELRMMRFKVRPLQGDFSQINFKNTKFIETLWKLGKLDEFFQTELSKASGRQRQTILNTIMNMYDQFQNQLNSITLKQEPSSQDHSSILEMEIVKERTNKQRIN